MENRLNQIKNELDRISLQKDLEQLRVLFDELLTVYKSLGHMIDELYHKCSPLLFSILSSTLKRATLEGHVDAVQLLTSRGDSKILKWMNPEAAVYDAVRMGHETVVKLLLDAGVDVNFVDEISGRTFLMRAARFGKLGVTRLLMDYGANANIVDYDQCSALMHAALSEDSDAVEIFRLILQASTDLDRVDEDGCSVLHYVSTKPEMAGLLLTRGVHVNLQDKSGQTALCKAAERKSEEGIRFLLNHGALLDNINYGRLYDYCTPLMSAIKGGDAAIVQLMVDAGADVNKTNWRKDSPIWLASRLANIEVIEALLGRGARFQYPADFHEGSLMYLASKRNYKVLNTLLDYFSRQGDLSFHTALLCWVARCSDLATLDYLLRPMGLIGCDGSMEDSSLVPRLIAACQYGQTFRFTGDSLARRDAVNPKDGSEPPLESPVTPRTLSERPRPFLFPTVPLPKVESRRTGQSRLLMTSIARRYHHGIYVVSQKRALLDVRDDNGETPLMNAIRSHPRNSIEKVQFLLDRGASTHVKNHNGHTALDIAEVLEKSDIIELLKKHDSVGVDEANDSQSKRRRISRDTV